MILIITLDILYPGGDGGIPDRLTKMAQILTWINRYHLLNFLPRPISAVAVVTRQIVFQSHNVTNRHDICLTYQILRSKVLFLAFPSVKTWT